MVQKLSDCRKWKKMKLGEKNEIRSTKSYSWSKWNCFLISSFGFDCSFDLFFFQKFILSKTFLSQPLVLKKCHNNISSEILLPIQMRYLFYSFFFFTHSNQIMYVINCRCTPWKKKPQPIFHYTQKYWKYIWLLPLFLAN